MALERFDDSPWADATAAGGWDRGHVPAVGRVLRDGETGLRPQRSGWRSRLRGEPSGSGGDGLDDGLDDEPGGDYVDTRPCPGPPHHNPRCCLAPKRSRLSRFLFPGRR